MNPVTNVIAGIGRGVRGGGEMYYNLRGGMGNSGFFWPGLLMRIGITAIIIVVAIFVFKKIKKDRMEKNKVFEENISKDKNGYTSALSILNNRYVSGEISDEEYLRKKRILNGEIIEEEVQVEEIEKDSSNDEIK